MKLHPGPARQRPSVKQSTTSGIGKTALRRRRGEGAEDSEEAIPSYPYRNVSGMAQEGVGRLRRSGIRNEKRQ